MGSLIFGQILNLLRYILMLLGKFLSFVNRQILNKKFSHLVTLQIGHFDDSIYKRLRDWNILASECVRTLQLIVLRFCFHGPSNLKLLFVLYKIGLPLNKFKLSAFLKRRIRTADLYS